MVPTATLDTNVLVEFWSNQAKVSIVVKLLDLANRGRLDLAITTRIREDIPRKPLADRINELAMLSVEEVGSVSRVGNWVLGMDRLADDRFECVFNSIVGNVRWSSKKPPPDCRDQDHIHGHYLSKRDAFLTWDKQVLKIAPELHKELEVVVMKPEEYLADFHKHSETPSD